MQFELFEELPQTTRAEITRIQAISIGLRSTTEVDFLAALAPYLTNEVLSRDSSNFIIKAAGNTLPSGYEGFKKGAMFIKKDASGNGSYNNTGDEESAVWNLLDQADTDDIPDGAVTTTKIEDGAVTNEKIDDEAVTEEKMASDQDLSDKNIGVVGEDTPVNSVPSTGLIDMGTSGPSNEDTITIGDITYTFVSALSTEPTIPNEILIEADEDDTLQNLKDAINGEDGGGEEGTKYGEGTVANPDVEATTLNDTDHTLVVSARVHGEDGDEIVLTEDADDTVVVGFANGVNGTPGKKGTMLQDGTNLYIAVQENTVGGAVWMGVTLSALGDL